MQKKVWINLNEDLYDVSIFNKRFKELDYIFTKKRVENKDEILIDMALKHDAIISFTEPWNETTLAPMAGKHKIIVRYGVGTDNIDLPCATRLGVAVANLPGVNSAAVAEIALLHILNLQRGFVQSIDDAKNGFFSPYHGPELDGKIIGIAGFGNAGRALARLISGFKVKIIAYDPYINEAAKKSYIEKGVDFCNDLEKLFELSDIVSLHLPLNKHTEKVINDELLKHSKPGQYLVNTSRGGIIDEPALVKAVEKGILKGVGLDVLQIEPAKNDNPLLKLKNVYISSHLGGNSLEAIERSQDLVADTISDFFKGNMPSNILNPDFAAARPG